MYEIMKRDISRFDTNDYVVDNMYGISFVNKKGCISNIKIFKKINIK